MPTISEDLISKVSQYAPLLGSALGGPAGGIVGALISSIFGGSDQHEMIKNIVADPDAAIKLKTLEYQHKIELEKINMQNYVTEVDDRKDARKNSPQFRDFLRHMAYLVTVGFFFVLCLLFIPQTNLNSQERELLAMLVGVLVSKWQTIIDFFYGSSHK